LGPLGSLFGTDLEAWLTCVAAGRCFQDKYARLVLAKAARKEHWGAVLKLLAKLIGDPSNSSGIAVDELYKQRTEVLERLGWHHLTEMDKKWRVISAPKSYTLF
jgi:hypothetical protein